MAWIDWKLGRIICIAIALLTATFTFGIAQSILGWNWNTELFGFKASLLIGLANLLSAWIMYKVL